jgi:Ca-activated chloride channel homolog
MRIAATFIALALATAPGIAGQQPQAGAGQAQPPAQESDDQVEIGGELVNVPFSIADKKNKLIVDVKKEEVQIFEDGKPQDIFSFERLTETPITIALLVDVSGSLVEGLPFERDAATRFFEKVLRPDRDLASVLTFSKEVTLEQQLTNNVPALSKSIGRARVSPQVYIPGGPPPINPQAGGTSLYDAVYLAASDVLRREAGRRVIILLTDGHDTTSSYKMEHAIERSWRSEVIIYAIGVGSPAYGGVNRGVLDKLCKETGGRAFEPRGYHDLDRAFEEIQSDLRTQYLLSYTPTNGASDGTFRKIEVKLSGEARKDARVRARRGYYAPGGPKGS